MTVVRKFKIPNRLRASLFSGGGKRIDEAVADADAGLATLAEACLAAVNESIARIESGFGSQVAGREARDMGDLYRLSASIIDACAPIEPKALADAARSLCDLLDNAMDAGRWDWPAVDIHIDALKLLASGMIWARVANSGSSRAWKSCASTGRPPPADTGREGAARGTGHGLPAHGHRVQHRHGE